MIHHYSNLTRIMTLLIVYFVNGKKDYIDVTYIHGSPKCKSQNSQVMNFIILVIYNFITWTTIERFYKSLKRTFQQHISHSNWNDVITLDFRGDVVMVKNQTTYLICDQYYNSCFNF
jgi:hypothetical protein